jgi:prepilin-type N-terminal cleavage/methylation domain-containing protein
MKKAFTMLELVFVIVVIGILAAVIIPRTERNNVSEAAIELESQIRYAQHLAIIDDKFDANNNRWYRNLWQIHFDGDKYSIKHHNFQHNENVASASDTYALDPQNGSLIKDINLGDKYNATVSMMADCAGVTIISFDHVGRPMVGDLRLNTQPYVLNQLIQEDNEHNCTIAVSNDDNSTIHYLRLHGETGYLKGF